MDALRASVGRYVAINGNVGLTKHVVNEVKPRRARGFSFEMFGISRCFLN